MSDAIERGPIGTAFSTSDEKTTVMDINRPGWVAERPPVGQATDGSWISGADPELAPVERVEREPIGAYSNREDTEHASQNVVPVDDDAVIVPAEAPVVVADVTVPVDAPVNADGSAIATDDAAAVTTPEATPSIETPTDVKPEGEKAGAEEPPKDEAPKEPKL